MANDFDLKKLENFKKGVAIMFAAYNRTISKEAFNIKTDMLMDSLQRIPEHRIVDFFKSVPNQFQLLPSDAQLMGYMQGFLSGGGHNNGSKEYDLRYGYFTPEGAYVPKGTTCNFLSADLNDLSHRSKELRALYNEGKINPDIQKEFESHLIKEYRYPEGKVLKHRSQWGKKDYQTAGIDSPDYITY